MSKKKPDEPELVPFEISEHSIRNPQGVSSTFEVAPCLCGNPDCDNIVFYVINPGMTLAHVADGGKESLHVAFTGFDRKNLPDLIAVLQKLAVTRAPKEWVS